VSAATGSWRERLAVSLAAMLIVALTLSACSHKKDTKKEAADKPMALVPISNSIVVQRIWADKIGGEAPKLRLGLGVAASDARVFVANHNGIVDAFALDTGKRVWSHSLKAPLSGGPSAAFGLVIVGTSKGEVIALSEADGKPVWRVRVNAEILAGPAIGTDTVVVRTVDGKLHGLSATDGNENWVVDQQVPRLSLRGTSTPLLSGDLAISGFDNGRLLAVNRRNGTTVWDTAVGQSHGSTELARLIDVDAPVVGDGEDIFAVSFQGRLTHLSRDTGQVMWTRDTSSYRGLAIDDSSVYVSTSEGNVVGLDRRNGTEKWTQKALERRELTAPVVYGGYVVVGDGGGVIHWLDPANGEFVARALVDKSSAHKPVTSKGISLDRRISSEPIVAGGLLLVFTDSGLLSAFRAPPHVKH
jgi:outer membrane protein assembly factor BamB